MAESHPYAINRGEFNMPSVKVEMLTTYSSQPGLCPGDGGCAGRISDIVQENGQRELFSASEGEILDVVDGDRRVAWPLVAKLLQETRGVRGDLRMDWKNHRLHPSLRSLCVSSIDVKFT